MQKKTFNWADIESLLSKPKQILNVKELASFTGMSISWIYKLCQQRRIPHSRPNGKLLMFDRHKIEEWLLSNPVSTYDIEQEAINYLVARPSKGGTV